MKRRLALTFAGSAALVLTAGSAAVAANLGILSSASTPPVGQLDAKTASDLSTPATSLDPIVVTVDEVVEVPTEEPAPEPTAPVAPPTRPAGGGSAASSDDGVASTPRPAVTVAPTTTVKPHESEHESGHETEHADD